jgi:hypothetical protein
MVLARANRALAGLFARRRADAAHLRRVRMSLNIGRHLRVVPRLARRVTQRAGVANAIMGSHGSVTFSTDDRSGRRPIANGSCAGISDSRKFPRLWAGRCSRSDSADRKLAAGSKDVRPDSRAGMESLCSSVRPSLPPAAQCCGLRLGWLTYLSPSNVRMFFPDHRAFSRSGPFMRVS